CGRIAGVAAIGLLAPVVSGRAYRRELVAFAGLTEGAADADGAIRIAGFGETAATLAALGEIDATKIGEAPAHVFLAAAASEAADRLAGRLDALGARIERRDFADYAPFVESPTFAAPPRETFAALIDWVGRVAAPQPRRASGRMPSALLEGGHFREEGVAFDGGLLAGVVCSPREGGRGRAVVFLNAGANPRIGWARQTVDQARSLAREGWTSLRFDIAGLGDSARRADRPAEIPYSDAPQADVAAALDFLAERGFAEAILVGPCSGAHLAFHSALRERRVVGLVMSNLQTFVWTPGRSLAIAARQATRSTSFYRQQIWRLETWRRLVTGGIDLRTIGRALTRRAATRAADRVKAIGAAPTDTVSHKFARLSARGARVMLVYSEEDGGLDELAAHLGEGGRAFLRLPHTRLEILADADHNLTSQAARDRMGELLAAFLREGELAEAAERLSAATR
ncbi:MAG: hypothetical protein JNK46_01860, partial [Methylobacteriaceae bacterium]|nr:hypothetical protein [Methylobacteriaceae bacterium]